MSEPHPSIVILAGPNGAGKSTVAPTLLQGTLAVTEFVDADIIARGLSAFNVESVAMAAGRVMLTRLRELARQKATFAFETTLASRSFAPWLADLKNAGYTVNLIFLWLPSADFAVQRVMDRVHRGGHAVPSETVRRRYRNGVCNFFELYGPLASTWRLYDNSGAEPKLVAQRLDNSVLKVYDESTWTIVTKQGTEHEG